ncbi:MAG: hypothetical protein WC699_10380 [Bacteroidales bacterium]|jgi:hypothetical protein
MRTLLSLFLLLMSVYFSYGQKALTFNEAKEQGLSSAHLDSVYASGINSGFIFEYRFQLPADKNFAQCSTVTYMPIRK